jgi:hypothetical protein
MTLRNASPSSRQTPGPRAGVGHSSSRLMKSKGPMLRALGRFCHGAALIQRWCKGVRIEDVEIDGRGSAGSPCSRGIVGSACVSRANIHSTENGIIPHSNSVVRNSFIHDLAASGSDPHYDGIQLDGGQENIQIHHDGVDLSNHQWISSLMINNQFGPVRNIEITHNLFCWWRLHPRCRQQVLRSTDQWCRIGQRTRAWRIQI